LSAPLRAGALAVLLSAVVVSVAMATPQGAPDGLVTSSIDGVVLPPDEEPSQASFAWAPSHQPESPPPASAEPAAATPSALSSPEASSPLLSATVRPPTRSATPVATRPRPTILAFGESVMLQSAKALANDLGPVRVDAAVGRQIDQGITILEQREETGALAGTVIVQLGNNGPFGDGQFDEVMSALRDVPTVIWVNVRVPREWEAHNNRIIEGGVQRYPNARMVDWNAATEGRPDLFWKDGYHPRPAGARLYADLVAAALR
jgi:hypothetical protein